MTLSTMTSCLTYHSTECFSFYNLTLTVIILNGITLSVIIHSVVLLNVVAPCESPFYLVAAMAMTQQKIVLRRIFSMGPPAMP